MPLILEALEPKKKPKPRGLMGGRVADPKRKEKSNCINCNTAIPKYKSSYKIKRKFCSHKCFWAWRKSRIKENCNVWKGEKAKYSAKHNWIHRHWGKADRCENKNCYFKNPKRFEWANLSGEYKRDRNDWKRLCKSCHVKMDYKKRKLR